MNQNHLKTVAVFYLIFLIPAFSFSQGFYFAFSGGYGANGQTPANVNLCAGILTNNNTGLGNGEFSTLGPFAFSPYNRAVATTNYSSGTNEYSNSFTPLNKGLGAGANFTLTAGYSITQNISFEIGFQYLAASSLQSSITSQSAFYQPTDTTINNNSINSQMQAAARYRVLPSVKFSVPFSKFCPYIKAGVLIGMGGSITVSNVYNEISTYEQYGTSTSTEVITASAKAYGGVSLGYMGSVGLEYKVSRLVSFFAEFSKIEDKSYPTKGEVESFTESPFPNIVIESANFTYGSSVTNTGSSSSSAHSALTVNSQYTSQTLSFGSWGGMIGIKISLAKEKPEKPAQGTN